MPHDPQSFADAVVDVINDASEESAGDIEKTLEGAHKVLDGAELDFNRYGDVLFEVAFAGGRLGGGGAAISPEGKKTDICMLSGGGTHESILPFVKWFQTMIRRRPFLIKSLESTLIKLFLSLEFFDEEGKKRIAMASSRIFAMRVGILADHVLPTLLEDRLVMKGTVLAFVTEFFKDYLSTESVESLMELLRKGRVENRILEFFPQQKRNWNDFADHFNSAGLSNFVEYNTKKLYEAHCRELRNLTAEAVAGDEPAPQAELTSIVKTRREEWDLNDADTLKSVFLGIVDGVLAGSSGRNIQQTQFAVLKSLKAYSKVLNNYCPSARLESQLLVTAQVTCYEDSRLLKMFADVVKVLYDTDVVGEDAVRFWYAKGSNPKGRNVFLKDMEPFMKWLDEAEEDSYDE